MKHRSPTFGSRWGGESEEGKVVSQDGLEQSLHGVWSICKQGYGRDATSAQANAHWTHDGPDRMSLMAHTSVPFLRNTLAGLLILRASPASRRKSRKLVPLGTVMGTACDSPPFLFVATMRLLSFGVCGGGEPRGGGGGVLLTN